MVVSPSWCELISIESVLWDKDCTRYKGWKLGGFPKYFRNGLEYSDQTLHADRYYEVAGADSQEPVTFRIDAVKFMASY